MYSLGVRDVEIGVLLSVGLFLQLFAALVGGVLSDKFGRRRTTFIVDFMAWTIPCIIWAFSQNFWWFFVATAVNSLWQVTANSWQCLLVEDAEKDKLVVIYNWIYISGLLAVFFAPLSGILIGRFSLVPVIRGLLIFSAVSMSAKFIILCKYSTETAHGLVRMKETRDEGIFRMILGYRDVFKRIFKSPATVRVLLLLTFSNITVLVSSNFFSLLVTQNLLVPEEFLAYFPILRAAIMLVFFFGAQYRLSRYSLRNVVLAGLGLYVAAQVLLLNAPAGALWLLVAYTAMDACAAALFLPRRDTLLIQNVEPHERARIMSLIFTIMLGVSSPFGYIAGLMSEMDKRLPFALNLCLFVLMGVIVAMEKKVPPDEGTDSKTETAI
jgi:MFS family permease